MNPPPVPPAGVAPVVRLARTRCAVALLLLSSVSQLSEASSQKAQHRKAFALSATQRSFIEDLSRRTFLYFQEHSNKETGLVLDRARADGSPHDQEHQRVASIAATGFGLTAWCIAADQKWVSRN